MKPQPSYAQAGSVYYICLLRDELLLHQGRETNTSFQNNFKGFSPPTPKQIWIELDELNIYSQVLCV